MGASHLRIYPLPAGEDDVPDAVLARLPPGNVGQIPGLNGPAASKRHTDLPVSVPTAARRLVHSYSTAPTRRGFSVLQRRPPGYLNVTDGEHPAPPGAA
jgi:hypothetical protein